MKLYLLYYDEDGTGAREEWSVFYTPCEIFTDKATRDARIAYVTAQRPEVICHTEESVIQTTSTFEVAGVE